MIAQDRSRKSKFLALSGDLEKVGRAYLEGQAREVEKGGELFIDLSRADFAGSGFLQRVVALSKRIGASEGRLVLLNPSDFVAQILRIARIHEAVEIRREE